MFSFTKGSKRLTSAPVFLVSIVLLSVIYLLLNFDSVQDVQKMHDKVAVATATKSISTETVIDKQVEVSIQKPELSLSSLSFFENQEKIESFKNESTASSALEFVMDRKEEYRAQNKSYSWPLRGIGFLHDRHDVVLVGEVVLPQTSNQNKYKYVIRINNVKSPTDCSKIGLWVRVNGPEIFAGRANATFHARSPSKKSDDDTKCHWEFEFNAKNPGSYSVDAKILVWNPVAAIESNGPVTCKESSNSSLVDLFPIHESFVGFKMYFPNEMCCEICSRLAGHCKAWSIPIPAFPKGGKTRNGCELYFTNASDYLVPYSSMINDQMKEDTKFDLPQDERAPVTYGLPHDQPTSYFIGCGWSFWFSLDFPCLSGDLDDRIFFTSRVFTVPARSVDEVGDIKKGILPSLSHTLCKIESESFSEHRGRWTRESWPTDQECPHPMELDPEFTKFDIMKYDGNYPSCWHRDDLSRVGNKCIESQCKFIEKSSLWTSSVHKEDKWYGRWQHDSGCLYSEFTDDQLQLCVDRRKLYGFKILGASIAEFLREYLKQRLKNINIYNNSRYDDGTKVSISTLGLTHFCHSNTQDLKNALEKYDNITASSSNEEFYWVSGGFLSSERALLCTFNRISHFNDVAQQILEPKGYKMINTFDLSAAFTYDTATQNDGLHIIGPTMKTVITKFFHYLCSE